MHKERNPQLEEERNVSFVSVLVMQLYNSYVEVAIT
jgi:hypothetical protein